MFRYRGSLASMCVGRVCWGYLPFVSPMKANWWRQGSQGEVKGEGIQESMGVCIQNALSVVLTQPLLCLRLPLLFYIADLLTYGCGTPVCIGF